MNQKVNNREHLVKQIGPIWKVKVAVYAHREREKNGVVVGTRRWKIKEILN